MIQHVSLECRREDAEAHRRFWDALGFTEVDPPESLRERAVWLQSGDTQIHLLWADAPVVPPQGHVAVRVASLDALAIETEERTQHWGERRVYARAPGGHLVELFETPPWQKREGPFSVRARAAGSGFPRLGSWRRRRRGRRAR